jgi:membrane protease subunit (stomatin/prohibitin family)
LGINLFGSGFDPTLYPEYRQMRGECDELEELFRAGMQGMTLNGYAPAVQPVQQAAPVQQPTPEPAAASVGPKFCPNCGAPTEGAKFCQSCGSKLA